MVELQRGLDHLQVGEELAGRGVGVLRRHRVAQRLGAGQLVQRRGQTRVDADQRAAVGLVLAVRVLVGRALGQRGHLGRDRAQQQRHRQLGAELVHLGQVVAQRRLALARQRQLQRLGGHEGVAVAVAADPVAHAEEVGDVAARQRVLDLAVHLRDLAQEGRAVVGQRVLDLVRDGQLGVAQHARLPELGHAGGELLLVLGALARGVQMVALVDQLGHGALGVEDGLALNLGRVRGQHRRDVGPRERAGDVVGADVGLGQALEGHRERPLLQMPLALVHLAAAHMVAILGDVGQVREVAEGADHADGLLDRQVLEQAVERLAGAGILLQAVGDRELADLLDQLVGGLAFLFADDVAEDAPEQADVLDQRSVLLGRIGGRPGLDDRGFRSGGGSGVLLGTGSAGH